MFTATVVRRHVDVHVVHGIAAKQLFAVIVARHDAMQVHRNNFGAPLRGSLTIWKIEV